MILIKKILEVLPVALATAQYLSSYFSYPPKGLKLDYQGKAT
jgi:hypothetical protein